LTPHHSAVVKTTSATSTLEKRFAEKDISTIDRFLPTIPTLRYRVLSTLCNPSASLQEIGDMAAGEFFGGIDLGAKYG
jgi:hypothetical protein